MKPHLKVLYSISLRRIWIWSNAKTTGNPNQVVILFYHHCRRELTNQNLKCWIASDFLCRDYSQRQQFSQQSELHGQP